jgi:hypothetical protein
MSNHARTNLENVGEDVGSRDAKLVRNRFNQWQNACMKAK